MREKTLSRARNISQVPRALHACLIRRLAERSPRLMVFDINFNAETPDDCDPRRCGEERRKRAPSRAHRGKRRSAPASAFRSALRSRAGDRVLPDGRNSRKGRHRLSDAQPLLSDHTGLAGRSLASSHRPCGRRAACDAGLPVDLALRASGHDSDDPDPARFRGGRVGASCGPLAASPFSSAPPMPPTRPHTTISRCRCSRRRRMSWVASSSPQRPFSIWCIGEQHVFPAAARSSRSRLQLRLRRIARIAVPRRQARAWRRYGDRGRLWRDGGRCVRPCATLAAGRGPHDRRDTGCGALGILRAVRRCEPGGREAGAPSVRAENC